MFHYINLQYIFELFPTVKKPYFISLYISVRDKCTAIPLDITLNLCLLSKHTYEMETTYQPS